MAASVQPLDRFAIPSLSKLLRQQFSPNGEYSDFANEAVLEWKFFQTRGRWTAARSWGGFEEGILVAHAGYSPTEFCVPGGTQPPVAAGHLSDWLSSKPGTALGALVMLETMKLAPVNYALGSTPIASRVLVRGGYKHLFDAPLFHRVVNRFNIQVWRELHGSHRSRKGVALLAFDGLSSLRPARKTRRLHAVAVTKFGEEAADIFARSNWPVVCSSREPDLLNYYLNYPLKNFFGYILRDSSGPRGFALLSVLQKPHCVAARIVECFLDETDPELCADAIAVLYQCALERKPDVISTYGSTPWMEAGLKRAGFFRRGKTPFFLRDPKGLVPPSRAYHVTHLEADLSFI